MSKIRKKKEGGGFFVPDQKDSIRLFNDAANNVDIPNDKITKQSHIFFQILYTAAEKILEIWHKGKEAGEPLWLIITKIVKEVVEVIEDLSELDFTGAEKKQVALTLISTAYDHLDFKIKILGIPIPGFKAVLKKYVMRYADMAIDWLVETLFNKDKESNKKENAKKTTKKVTKKTTKKTAKKTTKKASKKTSKR